MPLKPFSERLLKKLRLLHTIGRRGNLEISLELRWHTKIQCDHSPKLGFLDIAAGFLKWWRFALRASERSWN